MKLEHHPTVKWYRTQPETKQARVSTALEAGWLKTLVLEAGADDMGIVEVDRPELADQREDFLRIFPGAKSLLSIACRLNPENIRSVSRSSSDLDFKKANDEVDNTARRVVRALREEGVRCMTPSSGFPMDLDLWPGKMWPISHKPVAEAAGLGFMGNHRVLIHPRFGSFVTLGTILIDSAITSYDGPLEFNPCIGCGLCAAVCPVGAISKKGDFHFGNCMTHNYRDRLGGFSDWVERLADSKNALDYRSKVSDQETVSLWQGLSYGVSNKCSYCVAVCPAGSEMIGPFLESRKAYMDSVLKPLQNRADTVFVVADSDAEVHVAKRFPHKKTKRVGNGLRPKSAETFLQALPLIFQREQAKDLNATYHFTFTGDEKTSHTVIIRDKTLVVQEGLVGTPNLRVTADSRTWVRFVAKEVNLFGAIIRGKVRVKGSPALLKSFGKCFPS